MSVDSFKIQSHNTYETTCKNEKKKSINDIDYRQKIVLKNIWKIDSNDEKFQSRDTYQRF